MEHSDEIRKEHGKWGKRSLSCLVPMAGATAEEGEVGMSPAHISVLGSDLMTLATLKFSESCIQLFVLKPILHVLLLNPNSLKDGFQD